MRRRIPASGRSNARTDTVSFPFDNLAFQANKPVSADYPESITAIGDHIRRRRLDLKLFQKDVAKRIGVTTDTVTNWELGRTEPEVRYLPPIIDFLGYVPFELGDSFAERIKAFRHLLGLSQRRFAQEVEIDPSTLMKWETNQSVPSRQLKKRVETLIQGKLFQ